MTMAMSNKLNAYLVWNSSNTNHSSQNLIKVLFEEWHFTQFKGNRQNIFRLFSERFDEKRPQTIVNNIKIVKILELLVSS